MKPLLWKECREHLKWAGPPALLIPLPMLLLGPPGEPMFGSGGQVFFSLIAAVFGAALGFLQVYAEARGDQRALLLHRPLGRSRIFLSKAIAGVGLYLLALGAPFARVAAWMAMLGHLPGSSRWRAGLPGLA